MPRTAPRLAPHSPWNDRRIDDCQGRRLGTLAAVYEDPATRAPAWFLVRLGRYSARYVLTPPADVLGWRDRVSLPWERERIESSPPLHVPPDRVTPDVEDLLRAHFGLVEIADVHMSARRTVA